MFLKSEKFREIKTDSGLSKIKSFTSIEDKISNLESFHTFWIIDKRIYQLYNKKLKVNNMILIEANESNKNIQTVEKIIVELNKKGADRTSRLIALGGGVICDITGFVASIYMRGIDFQYIPTTLLSMVDASIGGKNGVNLKTSKNLIGVFNQPQAVYINTDFLESLSQRDFLSGLAEIIKYSLIFDITFYKYLTENRDKILSRDMDVLNKIVWKSIDIKAQIVIMDEKEKSLRMILNFGHTAGHAIESATNFTHGESVSIGMRIGIDLSFKLHLIDEKIHDELLKFLKNFCLPVEIPKGFSKIMDRIKNDKKKVGDSINFVLIEKIGKARIVKLSIKKIIELINELYNY